MNGLSISRTYDKAKIIISHHRRHHDHQIFHLSDWPFPFHLHLGQFHFLAHHQRHTVCQLVPVGQYRHLSIHIQSPLSQLSINSLPSLGDLAASHQHDTKCTIDSLHKVYAPPENPCNVATDSYHNCCASPKRSHDPGFSCKTCHILTCWCLYTLAVHIQEYKLFYLGQ